MFAAYGEKLLAQSERYKMSNWSVITTWRNALNPIFRQTKLSPNFRQTVRSSKSGEGFLSTEQRKNGQGFKFVGIAD